MKPLKYENLKNHLNHYNAVFSIILFLINQNQILVNLEYNLFNL